MLYLPAVPYCAFVICSPVLVTVTPDVKLPSSFNQDILGCGMPVMLVVNANVSFWLRVIVKPRGMITGLTRKSSYIKVITVYGYTLPAMVIDPLI